MEQYPALWGYLLMSQCNILLSSLISLKFKSSKLAEQKEGKTVH
jgi:hypothetical protein